MTTYKAIPGYEGIYEAGNDGTIWTCEGKTTYRKLTNGTLQSRTWKRRRLKPKTQRRVRSTNYDERVELWKNGKHHTELVSRMVALAFIPNDKKKPCINHIDGNPLNNNPENLEWCTYAENQRHAFIHHLNNGANELVLMNINNHECVYFHSIAEASRYLNKNNGYLDACIHKGKLKIGEYQLFLTLN